MNREIQRIEFQCGKKPKTETKTEKKKLREYTHHSIFRLFKQFTNPKHKNHKNKMSLSNSSNPFSPNKTQILSLSLSLSLSLLTHTQTTSLSNPHFHNCSLCFSVFPSLPSLLISVISYTFFMDVGSIAQQNLHNISFSIKSCTV